MSKRSEQRRIARAIRKSPQFQGAKDMKEAIDYLMANGQITPDQVIMERDSARMVESHELLQARGYWRSPMIDSHCPMCDKDFVLRVWTETMPMPDMVGRIASLPIVESEGGLVIDNPVVQIVEGGLVFDWVALCDACSPL